MTASEAGGDTYMTADSPSSALGYQSIWDIQIGLAGQSGLNRFGRFDLLVETTLVVSLPSSLNF